MVLKSGTGPTILGKNSSGDLPDEIFKRFQEWVAAQEDLERCLAVKLYAKGMIDGMVMLAQWLNGQGREVA